MLESLEGKRGEVRVRPPLPAIEGLFGKPTIVNNVISLASVPIILDKGAAFYKDYGVGRSRGTLPFQLAGNVKHGGLVEKAFGLTLREILYDYGGGSASGRPIRAAQVGGPLGAYMPENDFDTPLDYEAFTNGRAARPRRHRRIRRHGGHGRDGSFRDGVLRRRVVRQVHACRIGSTRGVEVMDRIVRASTATERGPARGVVRHDAAWLALRAGRVDPLSRCRACSNIFREDFLWGAGGPESRRPGRVG